MPRNNREFDRRNVDDVTDSDATVGSSIGKIRIVILAGIGILATRVEGRLPCLLAGEVISCVH
jgi:hypothetical protein